MDSAAERSATMVGLPEDILVEILSRVPAMSVSRCKCVSKAWRDLIDDPSNRNKLPLVQRTLHGLLIIPWKIYGGGAGRPCQHDVRFAGLPAVPAPLRIHPSLSFLTTSSPGIEVLCFSDCCNGLLLLEHIRRHHKSPPPSSDTPFDDLLGYVVCNPATKHWETVPTYGPPHSAAYVRQRCNYLVFDPAVSSHFHLVQFVEEDGSIPADDGSSSVVDYGSSATSAHVYSSETGTWSHTQIDWDRRSRSDCWDGHDLEGWRHRGLAPRKRCGCAILNGMLHFVISDGGFGHIAAVVDVRGATQRLIPLPPANVWVSSSGGYVARSQGRLHYINEDRFDDQLFVWVLEDYDAGEWVLKHTVSFAELFGKKSSAAGYKDGYSVVAMHPDANVIFFNLDWSLKMMSYDMDRKLVSGVEALQYGTSIVHVVPYVPCLSMVPALSNKHSNVLHHLWSSL